MRTVIELIGVYHADGGPIGELRYVVGKLLGTAHCGLCDITHSAIHRKPSWDAMAARLGVPFTLLHLNEMTDDVADAVRESGSAVVLARTQHDGLTVVLGPEALDGLGGSVTSFEAALTAALVALGLELPPAASGGRG